MSIAYNKQLLGNSKYIVRRTMVLHWSWHSRPQSSPLLRMITDEKRGVMIKNEVFEINELNSYLFADN